jgi:deoxyribose-phosphate aldolase
MLVARRHPLAAAPQIHSAAVILAENLNHPDVVASLIDHTLLKPEVVSIDIVRVCREAREFGFCSVCVNPVWVRLAANELVKTNVRVCAPVGFPLGANETATKLAEAHAALEHGAVELDMVQNIGALRGGNLDLVQTEIAAVVSLAHGAGALVKVILETCLLSDDEKRAACRLASEAGADFVKTSTGFSSGGARVEDVKLMRRAVGEALGVKASGGIRSLSAVRDMVGAGANRIGTSSGPKILAELRDVTAEAANIASAQSDRANLPY